MDNGASSYRRFLDGDDTGIVELVEDYKDGLILYLNGYVRNLSVAEELTEDTFFRLMTRKPRFSGKSSFKVFLYAIGRNVAVDYIRRNSKLLSWGEAENFLPDEQDLERSYIKEERKIQLHRAMLQLPTDYADVLHLVYFAQMSYDEAAKVMKKSRKQVDNLLYRGKKELRIILGKDGELLL